MRHDLTDITLVVDRSGSMDAIKSDAEGGVNTFIAEQAKLPGEALLTLVQFDTEYEFVHKGTPVKKVGKYKLVPRGSTALLDAVGRAINETGDRLAKMAEADRPGLVVFVIVTDGLENSSREFTKAKVKEMIEHQQRVYKWHFNYLAANQDAFAEGAALGVASAGIANYRDACVAAAYSAVGDKVGRMRGQVLSSAPVCDEFTDEERRRMQ